MVCNFLPYYCAQRDVNSQYDKNIRYYAEFNHLVDEFAQAQEPEDEDDQRKRLLTVLEHSLDLYTQITNDTAYSEFIKPYPEPPTLPIQELNVTPPPSKFSYDILTDRRQSYQSDINFTALLVRSELLMKYGRVSAVFTTH